MSEAVSLSEQSTGEAQYGRGIRAVVRGLWGGAFDFFQAFDALVVAITQGIRRAWQEGAAECGVKPAELTVEERIAQQQAINQQFNFVNDFLTAIEEGSKANGGKLRPLLRRAEMWTLAYNTTREKAKGMACKDVKARWIFGDTILHCRDCSHVEGRVYRLSVWNRYGWVPGSRSLSCKGYRCDCKRVPTTDPVTKGRPPAMKGPE